MHTCMVMVCLVYADQCTWPVCGDQGVHQAAQGEKCR